VLKKEYPEIKFIKPGIIVHNLYAKYTIGCYEPVPNEDYNPRDYRTVPLQQVATDILGLPYKEIKPKITIPNKKSEFEGQKYVCIAIHSTAQCKYWNNPEGWQKVVDYLYKHCPAASGIMIFNSTSITPGYEMYGMGDTRKALTDISGLQLVIEKSADSLSKTCIPPSKGQ